MIKTNACKSLIERFVKLSAGPDEIRICVAEAG